MGCGNFKQVGKPNQYDGASYNNFIMAHKNRSYKQDYYIGKMLGEGAFGQVYVCKHKQNNEIRVLKKMPKDGLTDEELKKNMVTDVMVLQRLTHPSIIKTYEFYQDEHMFYIVSEYCQGGALLDRVISKQMISEKEAATVMKQALEAINYSHQQGVMHRDLKLENIVLDEKADQDESHYNIKIIDYGCSTYFKKGKFLTEVCGTPIYIAPEVLNEKYNEKCDIWSLGILLYILLCGSPPFNGEDMDQLFHNIKSEKLNFDSPIWKERSDDVKQLISIMLNRNIIERPSASQLLQNNWFTNATDMIVTEDIKKDALKNLKNFQVKSQLQRAVLSYISTQLVTKAEQKQMAAAFKQMDKDGSGTISKEEVKKYFAEFIIEDELESHIERVIGEIDTNHTGSINYNEFITATMDRNVILSDKNLKQAFDYFDIDKNGYITCEELKQILGQEKQKQVGAQIAMDMINQHDSDGNQQIDFKEFTAMMKQLRMTNNIGGKMMNLSQPQQNNTQNKK